VPCDGITAPHVSESTLVILHKKSDNLGNAEKIIIMIDPGGGAFALTSVKTVVYFWKYSVFVPDRDLPNRRFRHPRHRDPNTGNPSHIATQSLRPSVGVKEQQKLNQMYPSSSHNRPSEHTQTPANPCPSGSPTLPTFAALRLHPITVRGMLQAPLTPMCPISTVHLPTLHRVGYRFAQTK
jgi:hypothetical protein